MSRYRGLLAATAACALVASTVAAAVDMQEGLWEITTRMEMPGMPFPMPAMTNKVCIGKGEEKNPGKSKEDKDCEMTDVKTSGNKTSWKMRCTHDG